MERKKTSTVFQLIKTMDRSEKRFFCLFCNRQNNKAGKIYMSLFKYINKQKKYDEFILKRKFKSYSAQFDLAKEYLYKLVLNSLAQYYTQENLSLYDQVLKLRVLYEKGLFEPAQKMSYKIRKLAQEQSNFLVTIETIKLESSLLLKSGELTIERINAFQKQIVHYMRLYKELESYKQMYDKVAFFDFKYVIMYRDDVVKEHEFKKISHSTLFKNINKPRSAISKWLLLCTRGMYYKILYDSQKFRNEYSAAIKILDRNPEFKKNYPDYAAQALKGYIIGCIFIEDFDLALQRLPELKALCSLYPTIETKMALIDCQIRELYIYLYIDRKNEAMQLINKIEEKIEKEEIITDSNKLAFYCIASETCALFSEYHESLHWVNKILNFESAEKKFPNMYSCALVIQLINLVELKEYDLLFYRMKSFHRVLEKQKSTYLYQKIFISFIRRILKGEFNNSSLLVLYKEVKEALANALKDPQEAKACHFFDFIGWFESKIENIPYTTWLKMNFKNRTLTLT